MLEIITMISKIRNSLKFLFDLFASRIASSALIKKFFFENRNKKKNHIATRNWNNRENRVHCRVAR